jgi:hypothetical protein
MELCPGLAYAGNKDLSQMNIRRFPVMLPITPIFFRRLGEFVDGKNSDGQVTLTASGTTTTEYNAKVGPGSKLFFTPLSSSASTALGSLYVSAKNAGNFELMHASNSATDQTFDYFVSN